MSQALGAMTLLPEKGLGTEGFGDAMGSGFRVWAFCGLMRVLRILGYGSGLRFLKV